MLEVCFAMPQGLFVEGIVDLKNDVFTSLLW